MIEPDVGVGVGSGVAVGDGVSVGSGVCATGALVGSGADVGAAVGSGVGAGVGTGVAEGSAAVSRVGVAVASGDTSVGAGVSSASTDHGVAPSTVNPTTTASIARGRRPRAVARRSMRDSLPNRRETARPAEGTARCVSAPTGQALQKLGGVMQNSTRAGPLP